MFGSQEIQKLMYKDKLVYEKAMLKSGTVVYNKYNGFVSKIPLELVADDWSNVRWGIKVDWFMNGYSVTTNFSKVDLLTSQEMIYSGNTKVGYIVRIAGKNELSLSRASSNVASPDVSKITIIDKPI